MLSPFVSWVVVSTILGVSIVVALAFAGKDE